MKLEPQELIEREQATLDKLAGEKFLVEGEWDEYRSQVNWEVRPYGQSTVSAGFQSGFPTCCGVCWGGYLCGLTLEGHSKPLGESLALLHLMEQWAINEEYGAMVMCSADVAEDGVRALQKAGWTPTGEFFNTAHGPEESAGGEPHRLIIWTKILTGEVFKKWGVKPKAKARRVR